MSLLDGVSAFANPFGAPSQGEWNLGKGVYTNSKNAQLIFFYEKKDPDPSMKTAIDQISDGGGRRLAKYEYPYQDGQRLDDLGRKGEMYSFNIKFWGQNYQTLLNQFLDVVVNDPGPGTLIHPVRSGIKGSIPVRFETWEFVHRYDEWNAVTIKAVFQEDNTGALALINVPAATPDSSLRSTLQNLTNAQAAISTAIFEVGALLKLPGSILSAMNQRLTSLTGQISGLLGQLGSTFSTNALLNSLASDAVSLSGGIPSLSTGTVAATSAGTTQLVNLPPVFQVGFDPTTQASINTNVQSYVNATQITPQQAVFNANQARAAITAAINEVQTNFGNSGYNIMLEYRGLAVSIQEVVESCIASAQSQVSIYVVPAPMSLRQIAFLNGLTADNQNDIQALNPYIQSINYVPVGTQVIVPDL